MGEVSVRISGRPYQILCDDGEEARVAMLAARIDAEASALARAGGMVTETRLLLMSALILADKLDEAETALAAAPPPHAGPALEEVEETIEEINGAARRIVALTLVEGGAGEDDDGSGPSRADRQAVRGARRDAAED
ncbi:MAG: cell division protein ZapA [Paracoccaceae bacterium]